MFLEEKYLYGMIYFCYYEGLLILIMVMVVERLIALPQSCTWTRLTLVGFILVTWKLVDSESVTSGAVK